MAITDITTETDEGLDQLWQYLLREHRTATGTRRTEIHDAIMLLAAEFSRRIDAWLAARS